MGRMLVWLGCWLSVAAAQAAPPAVRSFVQPGTVSQLRLSPDGQHVAMIVPRVDHADLVVIDRASGKPTANFEQKKDEYIADFDWVTDRRLIVSLARKQGALESPRATGELVGLNADGTENNYLFGIRDRQERTRPGELARGGATLLEPRADESGKVLIAVFSGAGEGAHLQFGRMDIREGKTVRAGKAPVKYFGGALTDHRNQLRFISGSESDRRQLLYYRSGPDAEWQLLNDERKSNRTIDPLAFLPDSDEIYARIDDGKGPGYVARYNPVTGAEKVLLRGKDATPGGVVLRADGVQAYAIRSFDGRGGYAFLQPDSMEADLTRSVMQSFPGELVIANSFSRDGAWATVFVTSDVNPGEYFLYEQATRKLSSIIRVNATLKSEQLSTMEPIQFAARDGLTIHGLLTRPAGEGPHPLLVLVHGGPYGIADRWGYNSEVQIFASRGYAVLQVNFRGSGGYGRNFIEAGKRQWGGVMQRDVTDATRWAIAEGHADAERVCIGGASYGAYAAMMGAIQEPELYRCAIGYTGLYDLRLLFKQGDTRESIAGRNFLQEMLRSDTGWLAERSPTALAAKLKQPVLIIHGGLDVRTPPDNAHGLRAALTEAGNPPDWYFEKNEAHGFYKTEHQEAAYTRMLAFLDKHLGKPAR